MVIPKQLCNEDLNFVLLERSGKKPFEEGWQKKEIKWDDPTLKRHLDSNGNYGVLGGGKKNLIIIDFDNLEVQEKILPKLPKTFTVKTGTGLLHKYFFSDGDASFKIFDEKLDTLADIQGKGKQVVGPGSIHPNGKEYSVEDDSEIAFLNYTEIKALLMQFDKKPKKEKKEPAKKKEDFEVENDIIEELKSMISIESLLSDFGVDTSRNPSNCPFHVSKGGKCLGWHGEVAHCFHCDDSWNIFSLVKQFKNCNFKESLDFLCEREGLTDELEQSRKRWARQQNLQRNPISILTDPSAQSEVLNKMRPYFYDTVGLWWLWNGSKFMWEIVDEVELLNMIAFATGADVLKPANRALILNTLKQEGRKNMPIPTKKTWIQFKDKIVDVETLKEVKASPKYFVTNPIPWELEKEEFSMPNMDRIFEEWVGKDNIETLYEIMAYAILPDYPIHRIFCFIGEGLNGKSCFLNLLKKFVSKENCCSTELDDLINSRFEKSKLHKKLVCLMGETNFNEINKTSILKKLSGGDLIGVEYKNKNPFEMMNYAKIIIATNNLPTTTDKTLGFYRRWMILDFPNRFDEKKDILSEIPDNEYRSLASRCVVTLKNLLKKREFTNEGSIEARIERYEAKSNFLEKFVKDFTVEDASGYITKADFARQLGSWCKENRHRVLSDTSIGIQMKKLGIESNRVWVDWIKEGGGQVRAWVGISWKK